jgi:hypothetical protein
MLMRGDEELLIRFLSETKMVVRLIEHYTDDWITTGK